MPKESFKNFVCFRIDPIHTWDHGVIGAKGEPGKKTGLAGYLNHDFRFEDTPNADKKLLGSNVVYCKKTKWKPLSATHKNLAKIGITDAMSVSKRSEKILKRLKVQVQGNSIVATALLLTISPEFLRDGDIENKINQEKLERFVKGSLGFLRKKYGNRLLLVCLHMDEMTPHLSAYILPLVKKEMITPGRPKTGSNDEPKPIQIKTRLGHSEMFTRDELDYEHDFDANEKVLTGVIPGTCSILQDQYALALQEVGLDVQRGAKAEAGQPKLKYVTAKQKYQSILRGMEETDSVLARIKEYNRDQIEELLRQSITVANEADQYRKQRDHYQRLVGVKQQRISELEKKIDDSMRELPIAEVIHAITGTAPAETNSTGNPIVRHGSRKDRKPDIDAEFHLANGQKIGVNHALNHFENLTPSIPFLGEGSGQQDGIGSINAVMYLTGASYEAAMARLASVFGNEPVKRAALKKIDTEIEDMKRDLVLPDESKWPELLARLKALNIDTAVIGNAKVARLVAANREGHLICTKVKLDGTGAEKNSGMIVIDPRFPDVNVVETGRDDMFQMVELNATHTVVCSGPLDALAIKSQDEHRTANLIAVGKDPGATTKTTLELFAQAYPSRMSFAENLLEQGRKLSDWLAKHFSGAIAKIPLPKGVRSWIAFRVSPQTENSEAKAPPIPSRENQIGKNGPTIDP